MRSATVRRQRALGLFGLCAVLALAFAAPAFADRDYGVRFTANAQGDITGTGNTLLTCSDADSRCAAARQGQGGGDALNNNGIAMQYVDVDGDPSTFNSSAATLALPPGARVLFAGLYYGGRTQAGTGGRAAPDVGARDQVLFKPPNLGAYVRLTASPVDDAPVTGSQTFRLYQGFVDVTALVSAAGPGEYGVANVQLGTGQNADQSGGWALAVAYEDTNQPTRNLTIFDGFRFVLADGPPVDIPLAGFTTPRSGPVTTRVGLVALEGDLGTTGDSATLNAGTLRARSLSNPGNPANNFFNASVTTRTGAQFTAKRPNHVNNFGFDADIFDATGFLTNGQTSTTLQLKTSGDGFAPNGVSFATDLFAPSLRVVKTVDKTVANLGDELTYNVSVSNSGLDAATDLIMRDEIPANATYVPGSLAVTSGAAAGVKTDPPGDDVAEFDPAGRAVVFRLGTGADATSGGRLAVNDSASFSFKVKVNSALPIGSTVVNRATAGFTSETLGLDGTVTSPDVVTTIRVPDLAITKAHTGQFVSGARVPFSLVISNVGDAPSTGTTTVTDTLDPNVGFVTPPSGDGWVCTNDARSLRCTRADSLAPDASFPPITYLARVSPDAPNGTLANTAVVSNPSDGNTLNNTDTDEGENHRPAIDLAIDKVALTPVSFPGRPVRFVLRVTNRGPDTATRVVVRDRLPAGLTPVSVTPSRGACAGTTCRLGRMVEGAVATIDVVALAADDTGGRRLRDVAVVSGREDELTLRNNVDSAVVGIIPLVDLVVTKTAAAPTVVAGGQVAFDVVVRNDGPSDATGVVVRDLPVPGQLDAVSATPTQGSCPTATTCALGTIRRGEAAQIVVLAQANAAAAPGATLTNLVVALPREPDSNLANNIARATVTVVPGPAPPPSDVVVTKTAGASTVNVGDQLTYTVTARNRGPGVAESVLLTDALSANVTLVSATPSQGTCTPGPTLACDVGPLAAGASAQVVVVVRALAAGPLPNAVTAIAPNPSPSTPPGERSDVAGVIVQSGPRVGLRKRADRRTVAPGGRVTFVLTATARGRGTARDIEVCDRMPSGLTVVDAGAARRRADGRWCWSISSLPAGQARSVRIVTRAGAAYEPRRVV